MRSLRIAGIAIVAAILGFSLPQVGAVNGNCDEFDDKAEVVLGILEHYDPSDYRSRDPSYVGGYLVRVAFSKTHGKWQAFKTDFNYHTLKKSYTHYPKRMKWSVCHAGKRIGQICTFRIEPVEYYCHIGWQRVEAEAPIPHVGDPSERLCGWYFGMKRYRPLVVTSAAYWGDPDTWKAYAPTAAEIDKLVAFLRKKHPASQRKWDRVQAKLEEAYLSEAREASLLCVSLLDRGAWAGDILPWPKDAHPAADRAPDYRAWFAVTGEGYRYLGSEMSFLDAGDYDNDGASEVIFMREAYNLDGYVLVSDMLQGVIQFQWNYH